MNIHYEPQPMSVAERNAQIRDLIGQDRYPLLPFEVSLALASVRAMFDRQKELGRLLGEAMSQGAETDHDNAPADAIIHDASTLAIMAQSSLRTMSNSDMFDFPTEIDMVTLGSVVELRFGNKPETTNHLISGRSSEIPEGIAELPAEIEGYNSIKSTRTHIIGS